MDALYGTDTPGEGQLDGRGLQTCLSGREAAHLQREVSERAMLRQCVN